MLRARRIAQCASESMRIYVLKLPQCLVARVNQGQAAYIACAIECVWLFGPFVSFAGPRSSQAVMQSRHV